MPYLYHTVREEESGQSVKALLLRNFSLSSSLLARLKRQPRGILLNDTAVRVSAPAYAGDVLAFSIADEPAEQSLCPVDIKLNMVYEDEYLLILDKPAGIPVLPPSLGEKLPCIASAYAFYYPHLRFHALNRLDKGTSGLMLIAKYGYIHERLQADLHNDMVRSYLGIAVGTVQPPSGRIDRPIARAAGSAICRCISSEGKPAVTDYETVKTVSSFTLLHLIPRTGRTHQLRLHLSSIGYPLAGDHLYGKEDKALISRPALHSCSLAFTHPVTGERLSFASALPEDMERLIGE